MRLRAGTRSALVALVVSLALTACWPQSGGDSGGTYSSPWPTAINVDTVGSLAPAFTARSSDNFSWAQTVVSGGRLFVHADRLLAYDATGATGCAGLPRSCTPLWSSTVYPGSFAVGPVVTDGLVWVGSGPQNLLAFDAAGVDGCSGSPRICQPVRNVSLPYTPSKLVATPEGFAVMVAEPLGGAFRHHLLALDHAGNLRFSAVLGGHPEPSYHVPAESDGYLFAVNVLGTDYKVQAFDAAGIRSCSGSPRVCTPLWETETNAAPIGRIMATAGRVIVTKDGGISVYDADGGAACTAGVCRARWRAATTGYNVAAGAGRIVLAGSQEIAAYPLVDGDDRCGGTPRVCAPVWTGGYPQFSSAYAAPTIAGGVVYLTLLNRVVAYDVNGVKGCAGTPAVCAPLTTFELQASASPIVVGSFMYVTGLRSGTAPPTGPNVPVTAFTLP